MQNNNKFVELPSFAGIALADILANGVAIILLMIIINLQIKSSAQFDLAEKVKDVSILLSRDIAKQVIMNALPTSPPARLHNYTTSRIDRFPREEVMPVLELHDEGVKNLYTNEFWSRSTLFSSVNDLDGYLSSLNSYQKRNLRIDVYDIKNFYLLKSILNDHGVVIRHWHFNGEDYGEGYNISPLAGNGQGLAVNDAQDSSFDRLKKVLKGGMPEGVVFKQSSFLKGGLAKGHVTKASKVALNIHTNVQQDTDATGSKMQHALMIAEEVSGNDERKKSNIFIRDYRNVLAFLFDFLIKAQKLSDNGRFGILKEVSLSNEIIDYVYSFPKISEYRAFMVEKLHDEMMDVSQDSLRVSLSEGENIAGIKVGVNKRIDHIEISGDVNRFMGMEDLDIQVQLSLYPEIFTSITIPITQSTIILMPIENNDIPKFKWHLVTVIDRSLERSYVGFIYSDVDENNKLFIKAEDNSILINQQPITSEIYLDENRKNKRLFVLYALVVFLIVVLVIKRKRL